ncbi:HD-GYP domain-containing protein [Spirochaeta africana]|uniref:HD-GYP domain-containing protein n=1 Tax=Spirochaeta africana (strain ATCC 700263 / DSM 8902 / Z-7692) TaxID=889378 RepID=H9UIP7_SPIAZ|nr:hypothetical protein [Spirochaeta africana]AFG37390.1 hypothetical protein Spiaf_1315 [Spirochaeta africana DSM 8902]
MGEEEYIPLRDIIRREPRALQFMASRGYIVTARRRSTGKERSVPLRSLLLNNPKFFRSSGDYDYFISPETARVVEQAFPPAEHHHPDSHRDTSGITPDNDPARKAADSPDTTTGQVRQKPPNFGSDYEEILELVPEERAELISGHAAELEELAKADKPDIHTVNATLTLSTARTAMINKATIQEALRMGNAEAQRHSASLVASTEKMVKSACTLLANDLYKEDLIAELVQRSNGTVVQHMTRVFLMGVSFLLYYNQQYAGTSLANRIRAHFAERYRSHYQRLLPHVDESDLTLERVFWGGMRSLTLEEIRDFAMGYLVHDVGKTEDIEYHEGEEGFDREKVVRHVKIGYKAVMEKTVYPREAALITGYHHEYYGAPSGYGYFRELLTRYKQMNPDAQIDHLMSYEMEPLIDYQVLAYFPAKMLEVIDVFDSLTDPNRLYRKPLTPDETIAVLRKDFVHEHVKVDPIILDLFEQFLHERGLIKS